MATLFFPSTLTELLLLIIIIIPKNVLLYIPRYHNSTEKQILDDLTAPPKYDQYVLPTAPMTVNVSVLMLSMSSPDESSLKYEIEFLLFQDWIDHRLMYDDGGRHRHLNALRHHEHLWRPDTYFILHGEFKTHNEAGPINMAFKVFPNGTVLYITRQKMIITCEGDLNIFPFDNPRCFFAVESMSYEADQLEFRWKPEHEIPIFNSNSFRSLNAYLSKNAAGRCRTHHSWRSEFSCLSVYLIFTRDKLFYLTTVFVPGMVLVTSSFISFWLDVNAVPARVMIGVTTMLNFCTTTNSFRSSLPVVSNLTAMNLWDGVCMFFIYASMIEFIVVNYLHRKIHQNPLRPDSADRPSDTFRATLGTQISSNGRKIDPTSQEVLAPGEFEVRAPLVSGEDPSSGIPLTNARHHGGLHHRPSAATTGLGRCRSPGASTLPTDERIRAAASVFAWLRRPHLWDTAEFSSYARLARSIDHISKFVFPLLFGIFSLSFFIYFAWFSPSKLDNWAHQEYHPSDD
ncbi:glutamate-gated chloride channel-like isoform X2 [Panonychus citri]|uniref:glutamate-gated chloride channel-like isoform X2 n=1 Tax=Panonychus citri TaxID=50023 RepID=UPI002308183C|nr:glutamate-gated chloride channel-like isoform X2 [Panonychus citri]